MKQNPFAFYSKIAHIQSRLSKNTWIAASAEYQGMRRDRVLWKDGGQRINRIIYFTALKQLVFGPFHPFRKPKQRKHVGLLVSLDTNLREASKILMPEFSIREKFNNQAHGCG